MRASTFTSAVLFIGARLVAGLDSSSLTQFKDSLALDSNFSPVIEAYWTGYPHHRRTPFAVSPDGASAYLAYLDSSGTDVHVQKVKPDTFVADGAAVTITGGKEAGGLVAHNDGFALLTNEALPSGTSNAPAGSTPVPVIYRYTGGAQTWKTFVAGPSITGTMGLLASPDMNGDLVYSEVAKLYGAYFVATAYSGDANGHYGDAIQYVSDAGQLQQIEGASSTWGCSHNTGILFEAADAAPFASVCAEDQGDIWLNTASQSMSGVKVSNENTTNGASGEPFGGMSGSYSGLARFQGAPSYIMAWVSNGAVDLTANTWLGGGNTACSPRNKNRNVAIAIFSDKNTLVGDQATSVVGAADGDKQINWITTGTSDMSNARVAAFDKSSALVSWEEASSPNCDSFIAMGCYGTYAGTSFQVVDSTGAKSGAVLTTKDVQVAGDMVTMSDGRICWPYVSMTWSLDKLATTSTTTKAISFACVSNGASNGATTSSSSATPSSVAVSVSPVVRSPSTAASSAAPTTAAHSPVASSSTVPTGNSSTKPATTSAAPTVLSSSVFPSGSALSPGTSSDAYEYEYECDQETTSAFASFPTVNLEPHTSFEKTASGALPSTFSFPTSGWAVPSSVPPYPTAASSGFGSVKPIVTAGTAFSSKSKHHGNTRKHSKTSKTKTTKSKKNGVARPTGYLNKRSEHHDRQHGTGFSSGAMPTVFVHATGFDWKGKPVGTAGSSQSKHHGNTRKHSAYGTGVSPTGSVPTGTFSNPSGDVVRRAGAPKKHYGNTHKHSSASLTGSLETGSFATGSFATFTVPTGSFETGVFPTGSFPTDTTSPNGAKNKIAIGLSFVQKPKSKKNGKRLAVPTKHHGNTRKHSSTFPTGIFPTGSFPTGSFPTGALLTDSAPTGPVPTGFASLNEAKKRLAIGPAFTVKPKSKSVLPRQEHHTRPHGTGVYQQLIVTGGFNAFRTGGVAHQTGFKTRFVREEESPETHRGHGNHPHGTGYPSKPEGPGNAVPTGVFPTGAAPTGAFPTGVWPTGPPAPTSSK
ncbi:hypothetical protein E2P81_ATG03326 [Venturia nashicola]|uniref:Uncharacterized protein n=1 Tax=Venturia nashicola TaxID=86259 RepID=A0A4Z1P9Y2_9PEZI|nr:hypothetical protein E6O75_ATG03395 [Venturia nashicola]TLD36437.1 hypothetical protein E2P81_ATG03326 [Venturia nashicola]